MLSNQQKILANYITFTLENDATAKSYAKKCGLTYSGEFAGGFSPKQPNSNKPRFLVSHLVSSTVDYYLNDGLRGHALRHKLRQEYGISILVIMQFAWLIFQIVAFIVERWNQEDSFLNNSAVQEIFNDNFAAVQSIWETQKDYTLRDSVEHFVRDLNTEGLMYDGTRPENPSGDS